MTTKKSKLKILIFILLTCIYYAKSYAIEPDNLNFNKKNIINYYKTKKYNKDLDKYINNADNLINNYLKDNNNNNNKNKNIAVIFDIDDTLLSTYQCNKSIQFGYSDSHFTYCAEHGLFTPIKTSINFYKKLRSEGIKTFIITGRKQKEHDITIKNLNEIRINNWDGLYLKPDDYKLKSAIPYKSGIRKKIESQGNLIILSIGDQISDSAGGHTKYGIKLPNPMYKLS